MPFRHQRAGVEFLRRAALRQGGIGTASRVVELDGARYTVGVLIQGNYGQRADLIVDGVPVGRELDAAPAPVADRDGSVIVVIATDACCGSRPVANALGAVSSIR